MTKHKRLFLSIILAIFSFTAIGIGIFAPKPARAIPVEVLFSGPDAWNKVMDSIVEGLKVAVINAAVNFISYFMQKIAYDSAVYLASGGNGQKPLFMTKDAGSYFSDVADEAAGKSIEAFSDATGLDLCQPPDINTDINLKIGLRKEYGSGGPPNPSKCKATEMVANWGDGEAWKSKFSALGEQAKGMADPSTYLATNVDFEDSDFGILMDSKKKIDKIVAKKTGGAKADNATGQGSKAVVDKISGKIKTPSQVIKKEFDAAAPSEKNKKSADSFGSVLGTGMYQVIPSTLSTFFNTLLSQGLKNLVSGGMFPTDLEDSSKVYSYTDASSGGRRKAEQIFSSILIPETKTVSSYNLLAQFSSCPESPGMNNCVMDEKFVQAVQEASYGKPISISEAIKKGWLNGSWRLIPPNDTSQNTSKDCYKGAYCYSNIKKLRLASILPLGFEIAAKNSNPDQPWTLDQVVKGFDDCNKSTSGAVIPDVKNKPFCHLIDPDWVLTIPPTRCNAMGYTNTILSSAGPDRMEECVDTATCVGYDSKGTCITYGYCTRSKNVWRISGDKCDSQYKTCISYKDTSNQVVSYLYSTLDTKNCDANNVGCNAFSLVADSSSTSTYNWIDYQPKDLKNMRENNTPSNFAYFNKNLSTSCSADSAGCTKFTAARTLYGTTPFYVKKAPDYLNCYDTSPDPGIQYPKNVPDLNKIKSSALCNNYAGVCIPQEENCNWYTDKATSDKIPGKFTAGAFEIVSGKSEFKWNDQCHENCAGYDTYREMPSNYSNGQDLSYIIPSSGSTCSAQNEGCSGFTNLATTTAGLEKIEYYTYVRPCIKPDTTKQKTFYTYEGSGFKGFQLKVYNLEKNTTTGGPKYFYRTNADVVYYNSICSEKLYLSNSPDISPDCRRFNDEEGNIYYGLLSKTIAVDASCTPYRLNQSDMYADTRLNETQCTTNKGLFTQKATDTQKKCYLCFQDGFYKDGYCFYNGLPGTTNSTAGNSQTCTASVDSCRAYKGNSSNNIEKVSLNNIGYTKDDFETGSTTIDLYNWDCTLATNDYLGIQPPKKCTQASVSQESTRSGEHSLGFTFNSSANQGKSVGVRKTIPITAGESYSVTFWMKADTSKKVDVRFRKTKLKFDTVSVNENWNYYSLGPVTIPKTFNSTTEELIFDFVPTSVNLGNLFIDNLEITKINQYIYLVKDSLKVDSYCDSNTTDNLPGEALGCKTYTMKNASTNIDTDIFLTGFSFLCRQGAIGCTPLIDTYNTQSTGPEIYNLYLTGTQGKKAEITGTDYSCQVALGETGCYVPKVSGYKPTDLKTKATNAVITSSTIYIPADTASSTPLYLVVNNKSSCVSIDQGCMYAGMQTMTPQGSKYTTGLIKNDPDTYSKILCQEEGIGCGSYASANGNIYFKDPKVNGQKICKYQTKKTINKIDYSGWFWDSVGVCGTSTVDGIKKEYSPKTYCTGDSDCSKTGAYNKCISKDEQACYPTYLSSDNEYGLWPFGVTNNYKGFVGECPSSQNSCTEYLDPNDKNKAYYVLNNDKITAAQKDCTSGASIKAGCVLFNQTDRPNKLYNSSLTYAASDKNNFNAVQPISSSTLAGNDSNIVFKVTRDRECGEWLTCRQGESIWDQANSKWIKRCDIVGRCNKIATSISDKDISNCSSDGWVEGDHELTNRILTEDFYRRRTVSWNNYDYVGLSVLNSYPIEEFRQVNIGTDEAPDWRLAKYIITSKPCNTTDNNGTGTCTDGKDTGICVKTGICVAGIQGGKTTPSIKKEAPQRTCRAYPTKDSPFPNTKEMSGAALYKGANYCNENQNQSSLYAYDCECQYTNQVFGDGIIQKYWKYDPFGNSNDVNQSGLKQLEVVTTTVDSKVVPKEVYGDSAKKTLFLGYERKIMKDNKNKDAMATGTPKGICYNAGEYDGFHCNTNDECNDNATQKGTTNVTNMIQTGICQASKKINSNIGKWGYCLEKDESRVRFNKKNDYECLTWYPIENIFGTFDQSSNLNSGYTPPKSGGMYYCAEGSGGYSKNVYSGKTLDPYEIEIWYEKNFGFDHDMHADINKKIISSINNKPYFNDIDYVTIYIDSVGIPYQDKRKIEPSPKPVICNSPGWKLNPNCWEYYTAYKNTYRHEYIDTNGPTPGKYIIRNLDSNLDKPVTTYYDSKSEVGCEVYEADPTKKGIAKVAEGKKVKNKDKCFRPEDENTGQKALSWSHEAESRIYKVPPYYQRVSEQPNQYKTLPANVNKKVMRFFWDDVDRSSGSASYYHIKDLSGWFQENIGDYKPRRWDPSKKDGKGDWVGNNTSPDNAGEDYQDNFEAYLLFDLSNKLEQIGIAHVSAGDRHTNDPDTYIYDVTITAHLREYCTQIVDAADGGINVAYTDNIWQYSNYNTANKNVYETSVVIKNYAIYDSANSPFGSLDFGKGSKFDNTTFKDTLFHTGRTSTQKILGNGILFGCPTGEYCGGLADNYGQADFRKKAPFGNTGKDNLGKNLFANFNSIFVFDKKLGKFNPLDTTKLKEYNYTEKESGWFKAPVIRAVQSTFCNDDGNCLEGPDDTISVNGKFNEDVHIFSNPGTAVMTFYAFANRNQMPIKRIEVDWDDGNPAKEKPGMFGNFRGLENGKCKIPSGKAKGTCYIDSSEKLPNAFVPYNYVNKFLDTNIACEKDSDCKQIDICSDSESDAPTFAHTPNACNQSYLRFTTTYSCSKESDKYLKLCTKDAKTQSLFPKGCCIYYPRVQVTDNWGWCNGVCKDNAKSGATSPGGDGCYDATAKIGGTNDNECGSIKTHMKTNNPWTPTSSLRVIIGPK